jgi:hypothetical protein
MNENTFLNSTGISPNSRSSTFGTKVLFTETVLASKYNTLISASS